ncbi:hypothetical protein PUN4_740022 [Paraburkholderia unamae]|nr:hypothetical protein PUN4_740022 [Paraburkholderia unamae]
MRSGVNSAARPESRSQVSDKACLRLSYGRVTMVSFNPIDSDCTALPRMSQFGASIFRPCTVRSACGRLYSI